MSDAPLELVADVDLQDLGKCLWNWQFCGSCDGEPRCEKSTCPWSRRKLIQPVLTRYERLCSSYIPNSVRRPALKSHRDLLAVMKLIQDQPNEAKEHLMVQHFPPAGRPIAKADQERAFNLAVSVLLSVNCGVPNDCADNLEDTAESFPWTTGSSVADFIDAAFGSPSNGNSYQNPQSFLSPELTAKRLSSKSGISFQPTDDLRSHLRLDPRTRTVYIFDCTAALEETLSTTRKSSHRSLVPRAVLLEILHTLYKVLFPPGRESKSFAMTLTRRRGFEKDFLHYRLHWFKRNDDPKINFVYFGERLKDLHTELKDPSPRNWFERLFEGGTKSAERKMLMATTIGVFIAVLLGVLGLVVAIFQAWIGYQQWQHPVSN